MQYIIESYINGFKNSFEYRGRTSRKEFLSFFFVNVILSNIFAYADSKMSSSNLLSTIYSLVVIVPFTALCVRRLHDTDHSAALLFLTIPSSLAVSPLLVNILQLFGVHLQYDAIMQSLGFVIMGQPTLFYFILIPITMFLLTDLWVIFLLYRKGNISENKYGTSSEVTIKS